MTTYSRLEKMTANQGPEKQGLEILANIIARIFLSENPKKMDLENDKKEMESEEFIGVRI